MADVGFKIVNEGIDTPMIQAYLGHKDIRHTVRTWSFRPCGSKGCGRARFEADHLV